MTDQVFYLRPKGRMQAWAAPYLMRALIRLGFIERDRYPFLQKPDFALESYGHTYRWFLITTIQHPLVSIMRAFERAQSAGKPLNECADIAIREAA